LPSGRVSRVPERSEATSAVTACWVPSAQSTFCPQPHRCALRPLSQSTSPLVATPDPETDLACSLAHLLPLRARRALRRPGQQRASAARCLQPADTAQALFHPAHTAHGKCRDPPYRSEPLVRLSQTPLRGPRKALTAGGSRMLIALCAAMTATQAYLPPRSSVSPCFAGGNGQHLQYTTSSKRCQ
jgi:hypothetical protein